MRISMFGWEGDGNNFKSTTYEVHILMDKIT
jgi:hypothetical protein